MIIIKSWVFLGVGGVWLNNTLSRIEIKAVILEENQQYLVKLNMDIFYDLLVSVFIICSRILKNIHMETCKGILSKHLFL